MYFLSLFWGWGRGIYQGRRAVPTADHTFLKRNQKSPPFYVWPGYSINYTIPIHTTFCTALLLCSASAETAQKPHPVLWTRGVGGESRSADDRVKPVRMHGSLRAWVLVLRRDRSWHRRWRCWLEAGWVWKGVEWCRER